MDPFENLPPELLHEVVENVMSGDDSGPAVPLGAVCSRLRATVKPYHLTAIQLPLVFADKSLPGKLDRLLNMLEGDPDSLSLVKSLVVPPCHLPWDLQPDSCGTMLDRLGELVTKMENLKCLRIVLIHDFISWTILAPLDRARRLMYLRYARIYAGYTDNERAVVAQIAPLTSPISLDFTNFEGYTRALVNLWRNCEDTRVPFSLSNPSTSPTSLGIFRDELLSQPPEKDRGRDTYNQLRTALYVEGLERLALDNSNFTNILLQSSERFGKLKCLQIDTTPLLTTQETPEFYERVNTFLRCVKVEELHLICFGPSLDLNAVTASGSKLRVLEYRSYSDQRHHPTDSTDSEDDEELDEEYIDHCSLPTLVTPQVILHISESCPSIEILSISLALTFPTSTGTQTDLETLMDTPEIPIAEPEANEKTQPVTDLIDEETLNALCTFPILHRLDIDLETTCGHQEEELVTEARIRDLFAKLRTRKRGWPMKRISITEFVLDRWEPYDCSWEAYDLGSHIVVNKFRRHEYTMEKVRDRVHGGWLKTSTGILPMEYRWYLK